MSSSRMSSEPPQLTPDWSNPDYRRSVAACLVQGVYLLQKNQSDQSLVKPWWEYFGFKLLEPIVNDKGSIFGATFEFKPPSGSKGQYHNYSSIEGWRPPRYVIALRGTVMRPNSFKEDIESDIRIIRNTLHEDRRFKIAMVAVQNTVNAAEAAARDGDDLNDVWLAGHSLGASIGMLAGRTMAEKEVILEAFLFNPPFVSGPFESIQNEKFKNGFRMVNSIATFGLLCIATDSNERSESENLFGTLSKWVPNLFVNRGDHISSRYIGYFKNRKNMEENGFHLGKIEKRAARFSKRGLLKECRKDKDHFKPLEPLHLLPSANLTTNNNLTSSSDSDEKRKWCHTRFKRAHGIEQWWSTPDQPLEGELYEWSYT